VNPRACHETELVYSPAARALRIGVVGAGPAGLACAVVARQRGHDVTLFDAQAEIGGQFNMAKRIPGKEEFHATLRYFRRQLELLQVRQRLGNRVDAASLLAAQFDVIVLATGVQPRRPAFPGIDHPKVLSYIDVLAGQREVGKRVAIIGAGGIGFDVAAYLCEDHSSSLDIESFMAEWGVCRGESHRCTRVVVMSGCFSARPRSRARLSARPPGGSIVRHLSHMASKCSPA
jgi:2,4-dienoyl-CoA reductase (NADPH2)